MPVAAELTARDAHGVVALLDGEAGVAPGQACVLYDGAGEDARVLGGGFIDRAERTGAAEAALAALSAPSVRALA